MSSFPSYVVYQCSVCARQTEIPLDGTRPDPTRCNITLRCRGFLERVSTRSTREFLFTPVVPGLANYVPRGTPIEPAPILTVPNPITVFSAAGSGVIALAGIRTKIVGSNIEFYMVDVNGGQLTLETLPDTYTQTQTTTISALLFEISPQLLTGTQYTYVISGPVQLVTGPDDSASGINLRFNSSNNIVVYVNGVELASSAYDTSVDNQITFTPAIYDTNNVIEVFVYQNLDASISTSNQVTLKFNSLISTVEADLALRELDCWGNYSGVSINGVERMLLYCTDLSGLDQTKSYGVAYFQTTSTVTGETRQIAPSEIFILLGSEPFSFIDKELYAYLTGTALVTNQSVLTYNESSASGALYLTVDETAITQVFNPITPTRPLAEITSLTTSAAIPGTPLEGAETLTPTYILGPV